MLVGLAVGTWTFRRQGGSDIKYFDVFKTTLTTVYLLELFFLCEQIEKYVGLDPQDIPVLQKPAKQSGNFVLLTQITASYGPMLTTLAST